MPALVAVVLAMTAGGAGAAYLVTRDDADGDRAGGGHRAERGGELDVEPVGFGNGVSVLDAPAGSWTLPASEVLPGGTLGPLEWVDGPSLTPELLGFSDVVVAHVSRYDEDTDTSTTVIFGVDAETGEVRWQNDEITPTCVSVDDQRLLVCPRADETGIVAIDPGSGDVVAEQDLAAGFASFLEDGSTLYVMHRGEDPEDLAVDALGLPDLASRWSSPLDTSVIDCCHGDYVMQVDGTVLRASFINAEWHIDRATGQLLSSSADASWYLLPGYEVAEDAPEGTTTLVDGSGRVVLNASGSLWADATGAYVVDGRIGIGTGLYDLGSGTAEWTNPDLDQGASWLPDHEHVLTTAFSEYSTTSVLDAADGALEVADLPGFLDHHSVVATDDAVVAADGDGQLTVHDLTTGDLAWSEDLTDVAPYQEYDQRRAGVALTSRAVVAAGVDGLTGFGDFPQTGSGQDSGSDGGTSYTTACGAPPEFVPVASEPANGGITITYEVHATCPGGQWLNLSELRVPFVVDGDGVSADSGEIYADGYFDFSSDPYWIPDDGETLDLVYPYDQTAAPADDIADAIESDGGGGEVVFVPCEPGPGNVEGAVPSSPDYGADPDEPTSATGSPDDQLSVDENEESALEALQRIAAEDEASVEGLDWTAQLSSKKPGTYDDGMVYDSYDDILALHLQLRAEYPSSLLVHSTDWPGTYGPKSRGYWVTLSGDSETTTRPVLDWCADTGRGEGDCWAVRVRRSGDPARNVDHAPADARNN